MDKLDLIESRISEIRPMMSGLQTLLTEQKEMKKKLEQMIVGNTIIEKEEYKPNLQAIYRIIMQKSDRFLIERQFDNTDHTDSMNGKRVACLYWVNEDTLYSNYEKCNEPECYRCRHSLTASSLTATCILFNKVPKCDSCYQKFIDGKGLINWIF